MSNPSPQAIVAIRARAAAIGVDWATASDAQALAALVADAIANPDARGTVPAPFVANDLALACSAASRPNLATFLAGAAAALIVAQDATHLAAGLDALATIGAITAADATAMQAVLARTVPDPGWPATLPQIEVTIGRPIDAFDVALSRP